MMISRRSRVRAPCRPTVQLSGFKENDRKALGEAIRNLGGKYIDSPLFMTSCTHVVCAVPNVSEKFLCGCAAGKWILAQDFINDSVTARHWLNEEEYEWSPQKVSRKGMLIKECLQSAPKRWRLSERRPFVGFKVFLAVKELRKREAYKRLVEAGGGLVYEHQKDFVFTHVFVDENKEVVDGSRQTDDIQTLPVTKIQDYILQDLPDTVLSTNCAYQERSNAVLELSQQDDIVDDVIQMAVIPVHPSIDCSAESTPNARVWKIVRNLIEEGQTASLTDGLFLCSYCLPTADILHTLLFDVLLSATCVEFANKMYALLRKILWSSPPWAKQWNRQIYMECLVSQPSRVNKDVMTSDGWNVLCDLVRSLLSADNSLLRGTVLGATTVFEFLFFVLSQDSIQTERQSGQLKNTILCQLVWSGCHGNGTNCRIREILNIMVDAAVAADSSVHHSMTLCMLCQLIAHISHYCYLSDIKSNSSGATPCSDSIVAELTVVISSCSCRLSHSALRLILESLQPAWLVFKVCQTILDKFTTIVERDEKRTDLEKMLTDHMFLIPSWSSNKSVPRVSQQPNDTKTKKRAALGEIGVNVINSPKRGQCENNLVSKEISRKNTVNKKNKKGETPLQCACIRGDAQAVAMFLEMGADPNTCDHAGWTPLHEACFHGHTQCVKELMKQGVTLEAPADERTSTVWILTSAPDGTTPIHDAINNGHTEIVKLLVKAGGKRILDFKQRDGRRLVDMAVSDEMKAALTITNVAHTGEAVVAPSQSAYNEILGGVAVSLESCRVYCLLLAHELRAYFESKFICNASIKRVDLMKSIPEKVQTFRAHLKQVMMVTDFPNSLRTTLQCIETLSYID